MLPPVILMVGMDFCHLRKRKTTKTIQNLRRRRRKNGYCLSNLVYCDLCNIGRNRSVFSDPTHVHDQNKSNLVLGHL